MSIGSKNQKAAVAGPAGAKMHKPAAPGFLSSVIAALRLWAVAGSSSGVMVRVAGSSSGVMLRVAETL
jgi:hypothetical protein